MKYEIFGTLSFVCVKIVDELKSQSQPHAFDNFNFFVEFEAKSDIEAQEHLKQELEKWKTIFPSQQMKMSCTTEEKSLLNAPTVENPLLESLSADQPIP